MKTRKLFDSFQPAMSQTALKAIKRTIKHEWQLNAKVHFSLETVAKEINPQVRGWINYYGKFYGSYCGKLKRYIDQILVSWARHKYKRLRGHKCRSFEWLIHTKSKLPNLFVHWYLGKAY